MFSQAFHSIAKCVAALAMSCPSDGESVVNQFVKDIQVQFVNSCDPICCCYERRSVFSKMEHFPAWDLSDYKTMSVIFLLRLLSLLKELILRDKVHLHVRYSKCSTGFGKSTNSIEGGSVAE